MSENPMPEDSQPIPAGFDEDRLVELLAEGQLSQVRIAEQVGICQGTVSRIASGQIRPDLARRVEQLRARRLDQAVHLAEQHARSLLVKQLQVAIQEQGETARKAREYLLGHLLFGKNSRSVGADLQGASETAMLPGPGVLEEFLAWQSEALGGPGTEAAPES
ncbi:MAG: helix-turn-helix domain-containing protein [Planctomycetota bacterium]